MKNHHEHTKRPFHTLLLLILICGATLLVLHHTSALMAENGRPTSENEFIYLPLITNPLDCGISGASYSSLPIASDPITRPAWDHPDINLAIRGYEQVSASLMLVEYAGGSDANAPQLDTLFSPARVPTFTNAYQIYRWDWACNCRLDLMSNWPTTLLGMGTSEGEPIHVPDSGYDIGGGNDVMVLYATDNRITLKYTREDNVVFGYTVHIEDICVDPALVSLYDSLDAAGRAQLPVLAGGQPFGRALGDEIKVSIRDTGNFLDPRSRKDWWQSQPPP
ncbi:hypothetical protein [Candidatus Leptofilum sp.]|uniref:hypothetical protein n=1 Tax=Candidatus Leptofilum sp. TaxID=3241576 RepID=UPI003B5B7A7F